MTGQDRSYGHIVQHNCAHSTVNHLRKEYCRGDIHSNAAKSYSAIIERVKLCVFHYISRRALSRNLNEIGFRWDYRILEEKVTKKGIKKKYMRPMPVIDMLVSLLSRCLGKQLRRTKNFGISSLTNPELATC